MAKVVLAGFNADRVFLKEGATPETVSAAYARISHSPDSPGELREQAVIDVAEARKSNEKIVYRMGHSSIAEHAVFNLDVTGLSRLATEEVQDTRIASFTEKSQRYVTAESKYVVPQECQDPERFTGVMDRLFAIYAELCSMGIVKEDARYVLPLATETQFGMTINARSLENMIRKLYASEYAEVRELAGQLLRETQELAPSLIKYVVPTRRETDRKLKLIALSGGIRKIITSTPSVELLDYSGLTEHAGLAAALYRYADGLSFADASIAALHHLDFPDGLLTGGEKYEKADRALEFVSLTLELTLSASCYAQLKRHRFTSQLPQPYCPDLGVVVPPSIAAVPEAAKLFDEAMELSGELYAETGLEYALTNAHKKRVLVRMDGRELNHFLALRTDSHAQWEIREIAVLIARMAAGHLDTVLFKDFAKYVPEN